MAANIIVSDVKYFCQLINGDTFSINPSDFATHLLGNIGSKMKLEANISVSNRFSLTKYEITGGNTISSASGQNFLNEQLYAGGAAILSLVGTTLGNQSWRFDIDSITANGETMIVSNVIQVDDFGLDIGASSLPNGIYSTQDLDVIRDLSPSQGCRVRYAFIGNNDTTSYASPFDGVEQAFKFDSIRALSPSPVAGVWDNALLGSKIGNSEMTFVGDVVDNGINKINATGQCPIASIQSFSFEQDFILTPEYLQGEIDNIQNSTKPDRIETQDLKHVLEFNFRSALSNPNNSKIGVYDSVLGNINYYNEVYVDQSQQYSISNLSIINQTTGLPIETLSKGDTNEVSFSVNSSNSTFTVSQPLVVSHSYLPTSNVYSNSGEDYESTWLYESVRAVIDGAVESGTIITNLDVDFVSSSQVDVSLDVSFNPTQQDKITSSDYFRLAVIVGNVVIGPTFKTTEFADQTPLVVLANQYTENTDVPGLATFNQARFLFHANTLVDGTTFTDLKGWIQDGILYEWDFDINRNLGAVIEDLTVRLVAFKVADNTWFELDSVIYDLSGQVVSGGIQQINVDTTRGFTLPDGDIFNFVQMETGANVGGNQKYTGRTAFKITWQEWQQLPGADTIFYDPLEPLNGLNRKASRYSLKNGYEIRILLDVNMSVEGSSVTQYVDSSATMEILDYGEQDFVPITWTPIKQIFDLSGNDTNGVILKNENTIAKATFTPDIPFTGDPMDYWCEVRIEEINNPGNDVVASSSIYGVVNGRGLAGNAEVQLVSGSLEVTEEIVASELDPNKEYSVTWRLGLLDGSEPVIDTSFIRISLNFKDLPNSGSNLRKVAIFQQNEQMANTTIEGDFFSFDDTTLIYRFNLSDPGLDGWDSISPVSFAAWQGLLSSNSNGFACIETTASNFIESGIEVRYDRLVASTPLQTATLSFLSNTFDFDGVFYTDKKIINIAEQSRTNMQDVLYSVVTSDPATQAWTDFSVTSLANLQTVLNGISEGTKYGIRVAFNRTSIAASDYTFSFEYDDQQDVMFNFPAGIKEQGNYRDFDDCILWDRSTEYARIINDTTVENLFDYSMNNPFTILFNGSFDAPGGEKEILGTADGVAPRGLEVRVEGPIGTLDTWRFAISFRAGPNYVRKIFTVKAIYQEQRQYIFTYDGSGNSNGFRMYKNGVEMTNIFSQTDNAIGGSTLPTGDYLHGANLNLSNIPGQSMEKSERLAIWNIEIDEEEVRRIFNSSTDGSVGLIRDYRFGQGVTSQVVEVASATTNMEIYATAPAGPKIPTRGTFV